ncbi:42315_t:CDS:2, partial [Gigaspora margarita]
NYQMQFQNLVVLTLLFATSGKVNLTKIGHFFAFNKTFECFGIKFVKENIGLYLGSENELKLQINSVQTEKEYLDLLLCE